MNRTGLLIAFAIAAIAGLAFGLYPELDLRISGYFYGFEDPRTTNSRSASIRF